MVVEQWSQSVCDAPSEMMKVIRTARALKNMEKWTTTSAMEQLVHFPLTQSHNAGTHNTEKYEGCGCGPVVMTLNVFQESLSKVRQSQMTLGVMQNISVMTANNRWCGTS